MPITYPTTLDSFTNPSSADFLDSAGVVHDVQHDDANDAITALEVKVGADASAVTTSIDYQLHHHTHTGSDGTAQVSTASLADVNELTPPTNSQVLVWDQASGKYLPRSLRHLFTIPYEGTLTTQAGHQRLGNALSVGLRIKRVVLHVDTPPTTQAIIVDINKNGVTIFTNQAHRPQIAAGANYGFTTSIDIDQFDDGDYLTGDIDQTGSGTAGSYLTIEIECEED